MGSRRVGFYFGVAPLQKERYIPRGISFLYILFVDFSVLCPADIWLKCGRLVGLLGHSLGVWLLGERQVVRLLFENNGIKSIY